MIAYTPPAEQHTAADHRYQRHDGALADCARCNRPVEELIASRAMSYAQQLAHPENRDRVAALSLWYLADRADILAGRPLSHIPDLP